VVALANNNALAVVLPVLTVVFGAALFAICRAVRAAKQQHSNASRPPAVDRTGGRWAAPLPCMNATAAPLCGDAAESRSPAAAAAVAVLGHSIHSDEQPLLDSADADGAVSPFAQSALQQQLESQLSNTAASPRAGAWELGPFAGSSGSHARSLVPLWLMRGRTMPADLLARAVDQFYAAQQQAQGGGSAAGAGGAAAGSRSSKSPEPPDPPLKR
jgi:hypothetical protein